MHQTRRIVLILLTLAALWVAAPVVVAQTSGTPSEAVVPVQVDADRLEYDTERRVLEATGNVVATRGQDVLRADYAEVFRDTQVINARGNVVLQRGADIWEGDELTYNFLTREGDFGEFDVFTDPFYVSATDAEHVSKDVIRLNDVTLTTCEGDRPDFQIKARQATVTDGETMRAKHVVFFLGPVPFFYLPYMKKSLTDTNIDIVPGYSTEMGAFLLTAYNYRINPHLKGATHVDYRAKRGVGVGQDFLWKDPEADYEGKLLLYYTSDDEPFDDEEDEALKGDLIDESRGRARLSHYQTLSDRAYVLAELNYLSDPDILEDFFSEEFQNTGQPENQVSLTHRGDKYTATLLLNKKLNDFYDNVDRIPEVTLDINRQQIKDSPLYYQGEHSAAFLRRDFADEVPANETEKDDYDSFRFDSANTVFYPTRHFGFLNVIPNAGYRGTYYSSTRRDSTVTNTVVETLEDGGSVTNITVSNFGVDDGAGLRNIMELGFETSFKAFKVLHEDPLWGRYEGLRHVAEPFTDYSYVPRPNYERDELYQFDAIDALGKRNDLLFGIRNKLQTKRYGKQIHDLVDAVVYTTYRLDAEDEMNDFAPAQWDVALRPVDRLALDFDGGYNFEDSTLEEFNTEASYVLRNATRMALEYRYRDLGNRNLVTTELDLFPLARWSFSTYWRYDIDGDQLEEHNHLIKTETDCLGVGLGYRYVEESGADDRMVWGQIWLTAFPESLIQLGR